MKALILINPPKKIDNKSRDHHASIDYHAEYNFTLSYLDHMLFREFG